MKCPLCYGYIDKIKQLELENNTLKEKLRKLDIGGWKGKDEMIFDKIGTDWHIIEHRKNKDTDEITTSEHIVPEFFVIELWSMVQSLTKKIGDTTRYRDVVPVIIKSFKLDVELEEFNGGMNRSEYYFRYYYYPIKVLERLGFIIYGGRGTITRLK